MEAALGGPRGPSPIEKHAVRANCVRRWVMCGVLLHRMCAFTDVCRYRLAE
jgi:hypothetical protein